MSNSISKLLSSHSIHPIVVDVGAAGSPPEIWKSIAPHALYIGFDPDRRDIDERSGGHFWQSKIINQAVTPDTQNQEVELYLTSSPHCSSLLPPDLDSLNDYAFANLFAVEGKTTIRATTLNDVVHQFELPCIDWLKIDTQGVDLRIYKSLEPSIRQKILAIDIEPGLIDAYKGEDLFIDSHRQLIEDGFWLSNLTIKGSTRISNANLPLAAQMAGGLNRNQIERAVRQSPGWCEARYLRTLPGLEAFQTSERESILLWCFAMSDQQPGFAFDVGVDYSKRFEDKLTAKIMQQEPLHYMRQMYLRNVLQSFPSRVWHKFKRGMNNGK